MTFNVLLVVEWKRGGCLGSIEKVIEFTASVKEKARSSGVDLVGIITARSIDSQPSHFRQWDDFYQNPAHTKKTGDYLEGCVSVVVLGFQVWDDIHEVYVFKKDGYENLGYMRMRQPEARVLRFIQGQGYRARRVGTEALLSQKRMAQLAGFGCFGKNSLIINPRYGPWFRLSTILTDAELIPDEPFGEDLCKDCERCMDACPVDALTPYKVDPSKCFYGAYDATGLLAGFGPPELQESYDEYNPRPTKNSILPCLACQKACSYGREERGLD